MEGHNKGKSLAKVRLTRPQSESVLSLLQGAGSALAFNNKGENLVLLTTGSLCVCMCVFVYVLFDRPPAYFISVSPSVTLFTDLIPHIRLLVCVCVCACVCLYLSRPSASVGPVRQTGSVCVVC